MKAVSPELEFGHLLIGNLDPRRIDVGVEFAFHGQTGRCRGGGDEIDDGRHGRSQAPSMRSIRFSRPTGGGRLCRGGAWSAKVPVNGGAPQPLCGLDEINGRGLGTRRLDYSGRGTARKNGSLECTRGGRDPRTSQAAARAGRVRLVFNGRTCSPAPQLSCSPSGARGGQALPPFRSARARCGP
jgi:hypothetical protein